MRGDRANVKTRLGAQFSTRARDRNSQPLGESGLVPGQHACETSIAASWRDGRCWRDTQRWGSSRARPCVAAEPCPARSAYGPSDLRALSLSLVARAKSVPRTVSRNTTLCWHRPPPLRLTPLLSDSPGREPREQRHTRARVPAAAVGGVAHLLAAGRAAVASALAVDAAVAAAMLGSPAPGPLSAGPCCLHQSVAGVCLHRVAGEGETTGSTEGERLTASIARYADRALCALARGGTPFFCMVTTTRVNAVRVHEGAARALQRNARPPRRLSQGDPVW